jgi:hypothetical protein
MVGIGEDEMKQLTILIIFVVGIAPASARPVVGWQCGEVDVELSVNKSTEPFSYNVSFTKTDLQFKGGLTFKWYPLKKCKDFKNGCAYLNGKLCQELD